jgi:uncharacterized integral membrane protein
VFFIALLLLILLGILAAIIVVQNFEVLLSTPLSLKVLNWHLPGIPVVLFCLASVVLGALALYVIAAFSARRDTKEMKVLRARVEELENLPVERSPVKLSAGSSANFAPAVVPLPGFGPGPSQSPSGPVNALGPMGPGPSQGPSGPANAPGPMGPGMGPGPSAPKNQWQPSGGPLQNMPPSASGNNLSLPPRPFPPQQQPPQPPQQQMGGPRPPFPHS